MLIKKKSGKFIPRNDFHATHSCLLAWIKFSSSHLADQVKEGGEGWGGRRGLSSKLMGRTRGFCRKKSFDCTVLSGMFVSGWQPPDRRTLQEILLTYQA